MRLPIRWAAGACALAALAWGAARPEEMRRPAPTDRFDALVAEIAALRADLDRLEGRERGILDRLEKLDLEIAIHAREMERLAIEKERATREGQSLRVRLDEVTGSVDDREVTLARHLRRVYTSGRGQGIRFLISAEDPGGILRGLAYLDAAARRQAAALEALKAGRRDLETVRSELQTQAAGIEDLARRERSKAIELERARREAADLLRATREESSSHRAAIEELTRAAEELEEAIVRGGAEGGGPVPLAVEALRGTLDWPVTGPVRVPFGDVRHPRFGTVTPHPGLDIETEPGAPVQAVLGGIVVYSDRFTGYGNTVLLDHGSGYISVYARLGDRGVSVGDEVLPGQTLGRAGPEPVDGGRPTVYFEFRREGKAVDPADWLKRNQEKRRGRGR